MIGAAVAHAGSAVLLWAGLKKIILALVLSPIVGTVIGFLFMLAVLWVFRNKAPGPLNVGFRRLQVVSAAFMAFSHGTADAQKSMGIITLALLSYGAIPVFEVPTVGQAFLRHSHGPRYRRRRVADHQDLGKDFVKLQPVHGFCVETAAAGVILSAASIGMPVSTTHVITSSILGVGLTRRMSAVNWNVAYRILWAWVLTIPASAVMAFITYVTLSPFLGM